MRLTVVGCSGTVPGPTSAASCYLLEVAGPDQALGGAVRTWRYVLDLGSGALGPLQRYAQPMTLDGVLLTHLHADHCLDVCGLYVTIKHAPGGPADRPRVPVWGPAGTADRMARAYGLDLDPGMTHQLDFHTWQHGVPVRLGPLTVTPLRVNHPVEAFGLRIEHDGLVLAYTGDTDTCEALLPLCRDAGLMLADAAFVDGRDAAQGVHLSGRRAAQAALDAGGVRRLVLTHLPPWNDADACRAAAAQIWTGPLDVAVPGAVYDL